MENKRDEKINKVISICNLYYRPICISNAYMLYEYYIQYICILGLILYIIYTVDIYCIICTNFIRKYELLLNN